MAAAIATVERTDRADLRGARLTLARVAYVALAAFMLAVYLPGIPVMLSGLRALLSDDALWVWRVSVALLDTLIHVSVALFILWRRPRNSMAIFTSFALLAVGLIHSGAHSFFGPQGSVLIFVLFLVIGNGGILLLPFLFPDGRVVPRWGPWYWATFYIGMEMLPFLVLPFPDAIQFVFYGIELMLLGGVIAQIVRYRHHSTPLQRLQTKWFIFGYLVFVVFWELNLRFSNYLFHALFTRPPSQAEDTVRLVFNVAAATAQHVASVAVPLAILVAVLRWRLFAIDLVINRTLVYGGLTVALVAVFALASALLQPLLTGVTGGSTVANIATALVVVGSFLPLRRSLQSVVDRFVPERALLTLLFTDVVRSTHTALALGDERWRELLERYRSAVRREIARSQGREVDNAGDGFFATFRSPGQAIAAAMAIRDVVSALGLETRTGIHVGECEVHGRTVTGINVISAARVMSAAEPDEILASATVRDLAAGSQFRFVDRGARRLKGLPEEWRLFALARS